MGDHDDRSAPKPAEWNTDATMDYPIGPDDAGNTVMYGIGILARARRWLVDKHTNRP